MTAQPRAIAPSPVGAPDAAPADAGPRLHGVVDVVRADRVAGWAIDRRDARASVAVTVWREGREVGTARADRLRRDLEQGGVGTGRYGFSVPLDPPVEAGLEFTVRVVARASDGAEVVLRPTAAPSPERRLLERVWEDLQAVSATAARTDAAVTDALSRLGAAIDRMEVAQARLEAQPGLAEPPPRPRTASIRLMAGAALLTGLSSLGLGLWSLWHP
jgi:hypothetical protein